MTGSAAIARPATNTPPPTATLAQQALAYRFDALPADVVELAKQCLLDWFAVTLAAADDPLVRILASDAEEEGGKPLATLVGLGTRVARLQAALINGAASHALDYDDVNMWMSGHPTVTFTPALLAQAEGNRVSGRAFIEAFIAGYETAGRAGWLVAPGHYARGFHATATIGAFAAAAACARLLGLDAERTATAFGIAGTQAAGLKSVFGTMCKPLHAGMAARAGLSAARWAAKGFTSRGDILECAQGFAATHSADFNPERALGAPPNDFHIRNNLFKYHAACYLTHAPIECVKALRLNHAIQPEDVRAIRLKIDGETDKVCNIQQPTSGLEAKFSLKLTTAFALAGVDTAALSSYSAANAGNARLARLRDKVAIDFQSGWPHTQAEMSIELTDGRHFEARHDSGVPESDVSRQGDKLVAKYRSLATPVLGEAKAEALLSAVQRLEALDSIDDLLAHAVR
ncbi:MmgE/PrpD family protein [Reyranella sp. CPCC 100927]|uniref:MmgE/PrpD family protein n=1 Tax=Reyranella sp. CPCC 100927 TaxID=2599616 RepID=UPI0011B7DEF6|nr:MmgE/PrpD family protein [Reyranella sp. CPCC 100927]TWS98288.1 MmgE/PrpD family protein [Reyranella sp. CPCC 100927]